jgi:DNA-binding XRE family transcriptional regulator
MPNDTFCPNSQSESGLHRFRCGQQHQQTQERVPHFFIVSFPNRRRSRPRLNRGLPILAGERHSSICTDYGAIHRFRQGLKTVQCTVPIKRQFAAQLKVFGANVRRERVAADLTQERLAEKADLNIRTLQSIEAGELNVLVTTAMRLQKAMECDWNKLMGSS